MVSLFGTSGIRGLAGSFITNEMAYRVGNLIARTAKKSVVVARDTRPSGNGFFQEVVRGITDAGKNVINLEAAPTPTLAFASKQLNEPGIMITASHNPEEYNGFKLFTNGAEISREEEKKFEKEYLEYTPLKETKKGSVTSDTSFHQKHINAIYACVDVSLIRSKKFKVVVDCNGAGRTLSPVLLEKLECTVHTLNMQESGFTRPSEPNEKNLAHMKEAMRQHTADIGFAHDGDADRVVVTYSNGTIIPLDVQLALMAQYELMRSSKKTVISTVESSLLLRETVERAGGKLIITRVSSTEISHRIIPEHACFGGEPCGEYVYETPTHCPDGPHAMAVFLEILAQKGNLEELARALRTYPIIREKFPCANERKYNVITKIAQEISIPGTKTTIDGLRVDEPDGWFLVRASGTEPAIRLTLEYKDEQKGKVRHTELVKNIQEHI